MLDPTACNLSYSHVNKVVGKISETVLENMKES